jgi:hypothetical protein
MQTSAFSCDDALFDDEPDIDTFEPEVLAMVRKLAAALDDAIDPQGDSRVIVAEALMRLAMGVHLYAVGAEATRDRALAMALGAHPRDVVQ